MLTFTVSASWVFLVVWGANSPTRGPVFWGVTSFLLSQTVYIPWVSQALARLLGTSAGCDLFMNVWGVLSAIAVLAALLGRTGRDLAVAACACAVAIGAVLVLAAVERPSPVGCVATLDVPWTSPYWWLLVLVHCGSSGVAAGVYGVVACRSSRDRRLALGMVMLAGAFTASTAFWAAMGVTLVTGVRGFAETASSVGFPITVLLTALALGVAALDGVVVTARARREIDRLWPRYVELEKRLRPHRPAPTRSQVVGSCRRTPSESVHQLRMLIADSELAVRASVGLRRDEEEPGTRKV